MTAGNVTWSELTKPYGHAHETGRKHSAFSEASFVRTVTAGVDPAGNKLSVAMPTSVYLLGTLVGKNITELVPVKMKDQVFLAFPTIPADISAAGAAEYSALLQKNKLISTHAAAQASAIAAAMIWSMDWNSVVRT